jgi:hypothetical protein
MNLVTKRVVPAALVLGLLVVGACGDDDDDTTAVSEAAAGVCTDVENLVQDVQSAGSVDASTTVDELKDLQKTVSDDIDQIAEQRGELAEERVTALQAAWKTFTDQIDSISGSDTLGSAATQVKAAQVGFAAAVDQIKSASKCTATITPTSAATATT